MIIMKPNLTCFLFSFSFFFFSLNERPLFQIGDDAFCTQTHALADMRH